MWMKWKISLVAMVFLSARSLPLLAHHGYSSYDESKEVTLRGTVTEFDWSNPHAEIYFDVTNDKGNIVHWGCETFNPAKLINVGWSKDAVKPGDHITITLVAARNGTPVGFLHRLVFDNTGKRLGVDKLLH